ncbi:MAG TPA: hypothetical protein VMY18_00355, partial [Acidobacteriota bacterium]|nr:hypothetical protein [Acidobacteriota bacterium]
MRLTRPEPYKETRQAGKTETHMLYGLIRHYREANAYMDALETDIKTYADAVDEKDNEINVLEAENRELREFPADLVEYAKKNQDRITELKAEVAKAQSRDIVLHRWLRAKQLRINELEAQLVTIGRKMLKDETNRAIIRAAGEKPNQETIDALTEDSSQMNTYETVDELMDDLGLT